MATARIDVVAGFNRAVDAIGDGGRHCFTAEYDESVDPMLRVRGVNQRLTWPFSARQAKQLFALYKRSPACMIPACDLTIKNDAAWDELLDDDIFPRIEEELVPEGPFEAVLSHLHIDSNGTTAKLLPTTRAKGSFGTLCIVLLSEHVGGDIHVTHGRHTQDVYTGDELYASFVAFYNVTTLTVSPMEHGRRVVLVYDLVYTEDHASRDAPPSLAAVTASLASLATIPRQYYANLAYRCTHQYMILDFEMLLGVDLAFVQAVADTEAYDIAFVGARKKPYHGDLQTMSEEELERDRAIAEDPNALMRVTTSDFYPGCATPPIVKACLRARPLGPVVGAIYSESLHIVVWPKQHRVRILGWTKAIEHLKLLVKQSTSDLLGYASIDAFALATIEMLGSNDRKDDPKNVDVPTPLDVLPLLTDLDSLDVTATFIDEFMDLSAGIELTAAFVHASLTRFGWEPLQPSMLAYMARASSQWRGLADVFRLLVNLAGYVFTHPDAIELPICASYKAPWSLELIKSCWHTLVEGMAALDDLPPSVDVLTVLEPLGCQDLLTNAIVVQAYLEQTTALPVYGAFLRGKLPPPLLRCVDTYLYPTSLLNVVRAKPGIFHPVNLVAPTIHALLQRRYVAPTLSLRAYMQLSWRGYVATSPRRIYMLPLAGILSCAANEVKLTRLLTGAFERHGVVLAPALADYLALAPVVREADADAMCTAVMLTVDAMSSQQAQDRFYIVNGAMAVFGYLRRPAAMAEAVASIVSQFYRPPASLEAVRLIWYTLFKQVHASFPDEIDILRQLVTMCLPPLRAHLASTRAPVAPNFANPFLFVPCTCRQCSEIQAFLRDGSASDFEATYVQPCAKFTSYAASMVSNPRVDIQVFGDNTVSIEKAGHREVADRQSDEKAVTHLEAVAARLGLTKPSPSSR